MSVHDLSVYYIKPTVEPITKYFLMVQRGGSSPFGGGSQAVFAVDELRMVAGPDEEVLGWQGRVGETVVCQFPASSSYLLVDRCAVEVLSPMQVARNQKEEEDMLRAEFPQQAKSADEEGDGKRFPGQYA